MSNLIKRLSDIKDKLWALGAFEASDILIEALEELAKHENKQKLKGTHE